MVASVFKSFCDCFKNIFILPAQHRKFLFVTVLLLLFYTTTGKNAKSNQFDYFIFSQRWIPTACIEYVEHKISSSDKYCSLPKNYEFWAIHGLWPTQKNHLGPFFCNSSMPFNVDELKFIESDLELNWPNIEGGKRVTSLWQHEWDKHGTCAAELKSLNNELKYFNATLNFFKAYNMQDLFKKNNILSHLNDGISVSDLLYLIKNTFGKLPQIHCIKEMKRNEPYLSEIRLCYNKNLELIDCGTIKKYKFYNDEDVIEDLTNCPLYRRIIIPDKIDNKFILENSAELNYYDTLFEILHIIQFLQWASI